MLHDPVADMSPSVHDHIGAALDDLLWSDLADTERRWEALISGPEGSPFEGGLFPATLTFPRDYPLSPPVMRFECDFYHPNVYKNGEVCISILHAPGDDPNHYEQVRLQ